MLNKPNSALNLTMYHLWAAKSSWVRISYKEFGIILVSWNLKTSKKQYVCMSLRREYDWNQGIFACCDDEETCICGLIPCCFSCLVCRSGKFKICSCHFLRTNYLHNLESVIFEHRLFNLGSMLLISCLFLQIYS